MNDGEKKDEMSSKSETSDQIDAPVTINLEDIPDEELTPDERVRKLSHRVINMTASLNVMVDVITRLGKSTHTVSEETRKLAQQIGQVDDKRRRDRIVGVFCVALLLTVMVIGGVVISSVRDGAEETKHLAKNTNKIAEDNSEQLRILKEATSPEAKAQQAAETQKIVQIIDCNSQEGLRRLVSGIPNFPVPSRTPPCEALLGKAAP